VSYTHILNIAIVEYVSILKGVTRLGPIPEVFFRRGKLLKLSECITEAQSIYETRGCKRTGDGVLCNLKITQFLRPLQLTKYLSVAYNGCRLENTYIIGHNFKVYKETSSNKIFTEATQDKCLGSLLSKSEVDIKANCKLSREDVNSYEITSQGVIVFRWDNIVSDGVNKLSPQIYGEKDLPLLITNSFEIELGDLIFKYNNKREMKISTLTNSFSNTTFCPHDSFNIKAQNLFNDFIKPYKHQLYIAIAFTATLILIIIIGPTLITKTRQFIARQVTPIHSADNTQRCCLRNQQSLDLNETLPADLAIPQNLAFQALRSLISQYPRDAIRPYNLT
jgi:hypothetical protein